MKAIACIGDSCVDHYVNGKYPGGNPVNFAVYYRRLGGSASFVGAVGSDDDGQLVLQALREKEVDCSHVQVLPGATPTTSVVIESGNRVFAAYDPGVMEQFSLSPADLDFIAGHAIAVTAPWGKCEAFLAALHARGVPIAYDCADIPDDATVQQALAHVDIAFFSDDGANERLLRKRIRAISALGPRHVIAMRGAKGSLAFDSRRYYHQQAIDAEVVDTLGAGDSYIAGFLYAFLRDQPIPACMRLGSENAAVTIGYQGAW